MLSYPKHKFWRNTLLAAPSVLKTPDSAGSSTHKCQFWPVSTYFSFENWHVLEMSGYCWSMAWNSQQNLKITVQPEITESFWQRFLQIIYYLRKMMIENRNV